MNSIAQRREHMARIFEQQFSSTPTLWVRAPGRVDLMGSHTDYNLGFVLTLPIGLDTWIGLHPRADRAVRLFSLNLQVGSSFELDAVARLPGKAWCNYVRAVAATLADQGHPLSGFDAVIHSTLPMSSGLSSSAALECATATAFEVLGGWKLDPVSKARLCQRAENHFVGVNCGILDQYTSCVGQEGCALLLDCRNTSSRPVKLADDIQIIICDTKYKRELAGSEYGQRRAQCEEGARLLGVKSLRDVSLADFRAREQTLPPGVARRSRFIIEENNRVLDLANALPTFDRTAIRQLTVDSFRGACELYEISVPAMLAMMEAMVSAPGCAGARQAGAGFGGCMVAFVEKAQTSAFTTSVQRAYFEKAHVHPTILPVTTAAGAGLLMRPEE